MHEIFHWIPGVDSQFLTAILIPGVPTSIAFCCATAYLKRTPGGPGKKVAGKFRKSRDTESKIELDLAKIRDSRKLIISKAGFDTRVRRLTYREDAFSDIDRLRIESKKYRSVNNFLQGILIVGSLAATGSAGIAGEVAQVRWAMLVLTFAVGISSGFLGYFKYKERSFYLQQTSDAIESEWEAFEIGVGRYKGMKEPAALEAFSEEVHRLKSEQKKRQQNLEQAPERRGSEE